MIAICIMLFIALMAMTITKLGKINFHFLSNLMEYDRDYSFPSRFEPNLTPFGLKLKENCHHDHIPLILKGN